MRHLMIFCAGVGAAIALAACGGSAKTTSTRGAATPTVVSIYSSLPLEGPERARSLQIRNGIQLALDQTGGTAGQWLVQYHPLDDASAAAGGWDAARTAENAIHAAADPSTVYYIGDLDSDASEVSIPILNQAGVPQVSPTNTYVGLTTGEPGSGANEPQKYYPTRVRTYLRIIPRDSVQAAALQIALKQSGCSKVAVVDDGGPYGLELARLLSAEARSYGVHLLPDSSVKQAAAAHAYAAALKAKLPDCLFVSALDPAVAAAVADAVSAALPRVKLFAPDALCTAAWTKSLPPSTWARIECTRPVLPGPQYPGWKQFAAAYRAAFHSAPDAYGLYGYEAMELGLDTIRGLKGRGDTKSAVLRALFAVRTRASVLGSYGFGPTGDTTLRTYGVYRVSRRGVPEFYEKLNPPRIA